MATTVDASATSTTSASNNIVNLMGSGSGIDIKGLAQQLTDAESAPREKAINAKITATEAKITGYGALKSLLSELKDAFKQIDDASDFQSISANNPAPDSFSVVTDSSAAASNFDLQVTQVALPQQHRVAFDQRAQSLNSGATFSLTYTNVTEGASPVVINVTRPTPAGIVGAINGSGTGLRAQLIDTGVTNSDGTGTTVYVSVTGPDGEAFTLTSSASDVDFGTAIQDARDAAFTLDGVSLTRSSNTISDVLDGVTLTLKDITSTTERVTLERQTADVVSKIKDFVAAYNAFQDSIKILGDRDSDVETYGGVLAGSTLLQTVRRMANRFITEDSNTPGTTIQAPRDVGLSIGSDGKLILKEDKLVEQLDARFEEVLTMFTAARNNKGEYGGVDAGMAGEAVRTLTDMIKSGGLIDEQSRTASSQLEAQQERLAELKERMQRVLERYIRQFTAMDNIVSGSNSTRDSLTNSMDAMNAQNR